ncbi:MAG: hypothetical protein ACYTFG_08560 [Planctomycetota bacterium]|jgi:hypothetical protein
MEGATMQARALCIAILLNLATSPLYGREAGGIEGDNKTLPPPVKFFGEEGFSSFLEKEPDAVEPFDPNRIPRVQKHLQDFSEWEELVFPKFAIQATVTEYYFGQNFGRNLIGRFFREGYGADLTGFIHLDKEVDAFVSVGWGILIDNRTDLSGVSTRLEDINLGTVVVGIKPFTTLKSVLGLDYAFFRGSEISLRLGVGGTFMQGVRKLKPLPEDWFWAATTLGTLHVTVGIKFEIFHNFFLFIENGFRAYSPPHASQSMRPHNETGPFAYLIWNGGFFVRFH